MLTFGKTEPGKQVGDRLAMLETTIFKLTYPSDSINNRTVRLKRMLLGTDSESAAIPYYRPPDVYNPGAPGGSAYGAPRPPGGSAYGTPGAPRPPGASNLPPQAYQTRPSEWVEELPKPAAPPTNREELKYSYLDELAMQPENRMQVSQDQLEQYFLQLVNMERQRVAAPPISVDALCQRMARSHALELSQRGVISHANEKGDNPDRRYTLLGGTDAVTESLVSMKSQDLGTKRLIRGVAPRLLKIMMARQDDRESLLSLDASNLGFAAEWTGDRSRLISCTEVVTKHAVIHPIPAEVIVGEKIEMKGVLMQPYKFDRITIAWEGLNPNLGSAADESEEALPYFPPLDYVAYARKSEKNHDRAVTMLKAVGIAAAIAGGMFVPPVALAAPLIAVSGSPGEHKPESEIPVRGGVKVEGSVFHTKLPVSNEDKEGIYYLTVWAYRDDARYSGTEKQFKSIPVSRRAVLATNTRESHNQSESSRQSGNSNKSESDQSAQQKDESIEERKSDAGVEQTGDAASEKRKKKAKKKKSSS